jgi:cyclopropane-fatty-acyl-phospholipid synthase
MTSHPFSYLSTEQITNSLIKGFAMIVNNQLAQDLTEKGLVPDRLIRHGIRGLLQARLKEIKAFDAEAMVSHENNFIAMMNQSPVAVLTDKVNEQHYEVPAEFFKAVLGNSLKYSCGYWNGENTDIDKSERDALRLTCERAEIEDGMDILELGCGWGSLTLWMARHYPNSRITAVSNSHSQGQYILGKANDLHLFNIDVITQDMNVFNSEKQFDRVVSVEMFEHMRNYAELYKRISHWLKPHGRFFKHIFVNRGTSYLFEERDNSDWMSRHFFSGGMMPCDSLPLNFQDHLKINKRWRWDGSHYEKTCNAWLARMDTNKNKLWPLFERTYGKDFSALWWQRWRIFFMACAELFGYDNGQQWWVSHYLFNKR